MNFPITTATEADALAIAALRTLASHELTRKHGSGHWSSCVTEAGVLRGILAPSHTSCVLVARDGAAVIGTLRLATKKPWAIDPAYFTPVKRTLYLHNLAVTPDQQQQQGTGHRLIQEAITVAKAWSAEAIRLDAYAAAGAGPFYAKCGFAEVGRVIYWKMPLIYFEVVF